MHNTNILLPMVAMAFWTFAVTFYLGRVRVLAVRNKQLKLSYFRYNQTEEVPEQITRVIQHYNNLFELNGLFYPAIIGLYILGAGNYMLAVILAWVYVSARVIHTLIHLGSNNVQKRFAAFLLSFGVLMILWCLILIKII